jgi:2-polyprenyl-6-methoxyphenol hydroxylase-like FAD-dependent oxidoreductase
MTPPLQQYVADARHALNTQPYLRAAVYGLAALLVFNSIWRYIKYKVTDRYTAMYDVEFVGRPRKGPKLPGTAVVAGGSFSGLLCARMLSDHYEKVLCVESEDIRPGQLRKFVLQYQQLHTFLAFVTKVRWPSRARASITVRQFMFKLWPDFREQMRLQGAKAGPFTFPFFLGDHTRQDPEEYLFDTLYISRAGMETIVRKLVLERCPNIEIRYKQSVTSIELNERKRVRAVNIRDGDKTTSVECALLIDATGPAIASRKWLPKVGFTSPEKITYDPGAFKLMS